MLKTVLVKHALLLFHIYKVADIWIRFELIPLDANAKYKIKGLGVFNVRVGGITQKFEIESIRWQEKMA